MRLAIEVRCLGRIPTPAFKQLRWETARPAFDMLGDDPVDFRDRSGIEEVNGQHDLEAPVPVAMEALHGSSKCVLAQRLVGPARLVRLLPTQRFRKEFTLLA